MNSPSFLLTLKGKRGWGAPWQHPSPRILPQASSELPTPSPRSNDPLSPFLTPDPRSAWSHSSFNDVGRNSRTSGVKAETTLRRGHRGVGAQQVLRPSGCPGRVGGGEEGEQGKCFVLGTVRSCVGRAAAPGPQGRGLGGLGLVVRAVSGVERGQGPEARAPAAEISEVLLRAR